MLLVGWVRYLKSKRYGFGTFRHSLRFNVRATCTTDWVKKSWSRKQHFSLSLMLSHFLSLMFAGARACYILFVYCCRLLLFMRFPVFLISIYQCLPFSSALQNRLKKMNERHITREENQLVGFVDDERADEHFLFIFLLPAF